MFRWLKKQRDNARRTGGLAEKHEATKRKIEVATYILDRRTRDERVENERRTHRMTMADSDLGGSHA